MAEEKKNENEADGKGIRRGKRNKRKRKAIRKQRI